MLAMTIIFAENMFRWGFGGYGRSVVVILL